MSEPKKHAPARRHLRRAFFGTLLAVIFLSSLIIYTQFFSPRKRLWRELSAYQTSIQRGEPRPDFVPHLTSNSVPFLLEWIESKEIPISFSQSLGRTVSRVSPSLGTKLANLDSSLTFYPPSLALLGFDFLGSQASAALPLLHQMAIKSDTHDDASAAMIAIGPNAFPIAVELARDPRPRIRRTGAHLLGALRTNPDESSAILLKLIDDPDQGVRHEAYNALAEFPSENVESILLPRLANYNPEVFFDVAYALHSASTNALLDMLSVAANAQNRRIRAAVFGALALRDRLQRIDSSKLPRYSVSRAKRSIYNNVALSMGHSSTPIDNLNSDLIRSNILATGLPRVQQTIGPAKLPPISPALQATE